MNIFVLDEDPVKAAQMQVDSHVVKMILESAQLLSTAHRVLDGKLEIVRPEYDPYRPDQIRRKRKFWILPDVRDSLLYSATHINHPSAVWVRQSLGNYYWLYRHYIALGEEYTMRYGKVHKSMDLQDALMIGPDKLYDLDKQELTTFVLAMPDEYKVPGDAVQSYRNYYKEGKKHLHKYTNREIPEWML